MVASFPVIESDQLVMVSDGGQLIRMPVDGISFSGRRARGVTLFRVKDDERVVSVTRLRDVDDGGGEDGYPEDDVDGDATEGDDTGGTEPAAAK